MESSDSDSSSSSSSPSVTSILSAEIKELRNKIMSVKKSVTKGDKKQKKAIQDELAVLEATLTAKQVELQNLKESKEVEESGEQIGISGDAGDAGDSEIKYGKSRAKRDRRKEEKEAEWEANRQAALAEVASRPDHALEESKAFTHRLSQSGFSILEISADGHCLFSAIGCQLDPAMDHWQLRSFAAKYLREHRDEYECFVDCEGESGGYDEYCTKIESTGMWGGQIELEALSRALNISITVIQAQGPELNFNLDESKHRIYLSYHRHAFSLGEHYNALIANRE